MDIVERLREQIDPDHPNLWKVDKDRVEAADEIERLRAEVEQQRKQWEDIWRRNVDLLAEIQRLEDALDTCRELREFDAATIARLRSVKEM